MTPRSRTLILALCAILPVLTGVVMAVVIQAKIKAKRPIPSTAPDVNPLAPNPSAAQAERLYAAASQWSVAALPVPTLDPPTLTLRFGAGLPRAEKIDVTLESPDGRIASIARLLVLISTDIQGEAFVAELGRVSQEGVEGRLALALGIHALRSGNPTAALPWLRSVPPTPFAFRALALAQILAGDPETAATCAQWCAAAPLDADGWAWRAVADGGPKALEYITEAAKLSEAYRPALAWAQFRSGTAVPIDAAPPHLAALILRNKGDLASAVAKLDGLKDAESLALRGELLAKMGKSDLAIESWKCAIAADAKATRPRIDLAEHLVMLKRFNEAVDQYDEMPDLPDAQYGRTLALLEKGDHEEAFRSAESGASRFPTDARMRVALGRVLHVRHDHYGEFKAYSSAVLLDPDNKEAEAGLKRCRAEIEGK